MLLPRLIAHRGYAARAPENTLAAIHAAADAGITWVELDVQCLADGTPVIWHDAHMARCSNGRAHLAQLTLEEARRFDVGSWFDAKFAGERIATLEEALEAVESRGLGLNLELKVCTARDPIRLTERVLPVLEGVLPAERLLVSSFSQEALYRARRLDHELHLGILYDEKVPRVWKWDAERIGAVSVHANWEHLNPDRMSDIKNAGLNVVCYTINDPQAFQSWWDRGVDAVISDDPLLFEQFEQQRERYQAQLHELEARCPTTVKKA
ncbi:glycerophosphodiester phosphodiesterase family protein [Halotalea alkalilenta]|uniref:glycerophosphodiester phosphodiesterase family protein n=1 Tax=Halotalea alkalilenta TaxID=376489 RepID=UPI0009DDAFE6|nr:glycerophosphodiester phosphodiesterase family protein [Halotalea alkalilenta]